MKWVRVDIEFYLPHPQSETHYVKTDNRGAAVCRVMDTFRGAEMKYLNKIEVKLCESPSQEELSHPFVKTTSLGA